MENSTIKIGHVPTSVYLIYSKDDVVQKVNDFNAIKGLLFDEPISSDIVE